MIKLSTFMLNPVEAHSRYVKEIANIHEEYKELISNMQKTIDKQAKKNATLKHEIKSIQKNR